VEARPGTIDEGIAYVTNIQAFEMALAHLHVREMA
jgi:hypothetical protein